MVGGLGFGVAGFKVWGFGFGVVCLGFRFGFGFRGVRFNV